ncbi:hypothetical protein BJ912DRAFT_1062817 [Pholiota molesta]|nr:hypothetical protein BJ912DRAFT_1062817 [Pholiota molesta]
MLPSIHSTQHPSPLPPPPSPTHHRADTTAATSSQETASAPEEGGRGRAAEGEGGTAEGKDRPHDQVRAPPLPFIHTNLPPQRHVTAGQPYALSDGKAAHAESTSHVSTPPRSTQVQPDATSTRTRGTRRPSPSPPHCPPQPVLATALPAAASARHRMPAAIRPSRDAISAYAAPGAFSRDPHPATAHVRPRMTRQSVPARARGRSRGAVVSTCPRSPHIRGTTPHTVSAYDEHCTGSVQGHGDAARSWYCKPAGYPYPYPYPSTRATSTRGSTGMGMRGYGYG